MKQFNVNPIADVRANDKHLAYINKLLKETDKHFDYVHAKPVKVEMDKPKRNKRAKDDAFASNPLHNNFKGTVKEFNAIPANDNIAKEIIQYANIELYLKSDKVNQLMGEWDKEIELRNPTIVEGKDPCYKHETVNTNGLGDLPDCEEEKECVFFGDIVERSHLTEEWDCSGDMYAVPEWMAKSIDNIRKLKSPEVIKEVVREDDYSPFTSTISLDKIYEGVWALNGRKGSCGPNDRRNFKNDRLYIWMDGISTRDFKAFLKFHNILILTDYNSNLRIMVGKKPITNRDIYLSLIHLRDVCTIADRHLIKSPYGSLANHIYYLRQSSLNKALKSMSRNKIQEIPDYCYYDQIDHAPTIYDEAQSWDKYVDLVVSCDRTIGNEMIMNELLIQITLDLKVTVEYTDVEEDLSTEQIKDLVFNVNGARAERTEVTE